MRPLKLVINESWSYGNIYAITKLFHAMENEGVFKQN